MGGLSPRMDTCWTIAGWCPTIPSSQHAMTVTSMWRSVPLWGQCTTFTNMSTRDLTMPIWSWRCAFTSWGHGGYQNRRAVTSIHRGRREAT